MGTSQTIQAGLATIALATALAIGACSKQDPIESPSGRAIGPPSMEVSFDDYVQSTRAQLRDVLSSKRFSRENKPFGDYDIDQVVEMRAPYALEPETLSCDVTGSDPTKGNRVGFLMVHGLTDSPYWLSDVRDDLRKRFPCASFHGVLLPGHGTVPGDLMDVCFDDWLQTVRFGVNSFDDEIDHIIPVGFSTGAALIGRVFAEQTHDDRIKGLIMLSPGLAAKSDQAWLTPYVRYVRHWVGQGQNNDPGKYGSMAMNAAAEFHLLTEPYREGTLPSLNVPVFAVVSSDDQTINAGRVVDFFCDKVTHPTRNLIWYQGETALPRTASSCEGIDIVPSENPELRTLNHAHIAITLRPNNPVYGIDGPVVDCGHYDEDMAHAACLNGPDTVYGERNLLDSVTPGTLRRGTFNPDFTGMMGKMSGFVIATLTGENITGN